MTEQGERDKLARARIAEEASGVGEGLLQVAVLGDGLLDPGHDLLE